MCDCIICQSNRVDYGEPAVSEKDEMPINCPQCGEKLLLWGFCDNCTATITLRCTQNG